MKLEVEFDNCVDDGDTYVALTKADVVLKLEGHGALAPISMFDGRHATYELPEGTTEDDLIEALDGCSWCFTGITEVKPEEPTLG